MSEAIRFLHALAQALATMTLYSPGHPAARRAVSTTWDALQALLQADATPIFFFLGGAPVYRGRALHEISGWSWSPRLAQAGIQRLEFTEAVTAEGLTQALDRLLDQVSHDRSDDSDSVPAIPGVLFGSVVVEEIEEPTAEDGMAQVEGSREVQLDLPDEIDAMTFLLAEARQGRLARAEAEAVVRLLGGLLDTHPLPQVLAPSDHAGYAPVHALNTALLTMAAGTVSGVDRVGRHRLGLAALLHDIGMACLPDRLAVQESLSPEERVLIETHTTLGASLLVQTGGRGLELAAIVAWEHHLRPDGTGYPARRIRPTPHWASRLIGVAAAYNALRAARPYRPAWSPDRALGYLETEAGRVFDPEAARLLVGLVRGGG